MTPRGLGATWPPTEIRAVVVDGPTLLAAFPRVAAADAFADLIRARGGRVRVVEIEWETIDREDLARALRVNPGEDLVDAAERRTDALSDVCHVLDVDLDRAERAVDKAGDACDARDTLASVARHMGWMAGQEEASAADLASALADLREVLDAAEDVVRVVAAARALVRG